jgi:hypothetical protein
MTLDNILLDVLKNEDEETNDEVEIPRNETKQGAQIRDFYTMVRWFKNNHCDIPKSFRRLNAMYDEHNTPLCVYWLKDVTETNKEVPSYMKIPEWMRPDPNHQDDFGYTTAMYWIMWFNIPVPEYLWHDPNIINKKGKNILMIHYIYNGVDYVNKQNFEEPFHIPEWMLKNINLSHVDEEGFTIHDYDKIIFGKKKEE